MYADDTVIFTPGKTQKITGTNLTTDFNFQTCGRLDGVKRTHVEHEQRKD